MNRIHHFAATNNDRRCATSRSPFISLGACVLVILLFVITSSAQHSDATYPNDDAIFPPHQQQEEDVEVPPLLGPPPSTHRQQAAHRTFRTQAAISNGSTVRILYISNDHSTESIAIAQSRQRFSARAVAAYNITIISQLLLFSEVPNAAALLAAVPNASQLIHVSVATTLFNQTIPFVLPNITFCFLLSTTLNTTLTDLFNVIQSSIPDTNMGMEIGMLAGLVSRSGIVGMWYDVSRRNAVSGVQAGLATVCPLCTLKAYALCSGGLLCPGEIQQAFTWTYQADVIITVFTFSNVIPAQVFALNANGTTSASGVVYPPKWRRVLMMGNRLGDLTTNTTNHNDFLGAISLVSGSLALSITQVILGTYDGAGATVGYYWSTNLKNKLYVAPNASSGSSTTSSSISGGSTVLSGSGSGSVATMPYLTNTIYVEFLLRRFSFEVGAIVPTFDVIAEAQADDEIVGGPPFIPYGHTCTGLDYVSDTSGGAAYQLIPAAVMTQSAFCVHGTTTVLLSSDLRTALVFHAKIGQFVTIQLNSFTDADYANGVNYSQTAGSSELLKAQWFQNSSLRRPTLPAPHRVGMQCNVMDDAFVLTGGYLLTDNFTYTNATASTDVLRLIPMCSSRVAVNNFSTVPNCDIYILQNVTDLFQDNTRVVRESWDETPRTGGSALAVGGVKVAAAASTNATMRPVIASARVFLPNYLLPYVSTQAVYAIGSIVNATTFETVATFRVYPPAAAGATPALAAKNFIPLVMTYVQAVAGFIAYDSARRNIVLLSSTRIDFVVRSALSGSSTTSASTFARWQDVTTALPTGFTPMCVFYNAAASRYAVLMTATGSLAPQVFHYSSVLRSWVWQATYDNSATPNEQYGCVPLNEMLGGVALILPVTTWRLTSMSIVYYPAAVPKCSPSSGLVLAVSQRTCTRCNGSMVATSDGFCIPVTNTSAAVLEGWMIALIAIVAGCLVLILVVIGVRKCRRFLDPRRLARLPKYAPPTGNCACLFVGISDADVMWAGDVNELSFRADQPLSVSGAQEQLEEMRELMDEFNDTLCKSVAANRCYLMSFRGDTAVVIGATPADVLCVAVELSSAFAAQDPPVRLSCGLHMAQLIQERVVKYATKKQLKKQMESSGTGSTSSSGSSDIGKPKFSYAGQGLHIATKLSAVSKKGRLMASHIFLDEINQHLMKHLGVVRGDTMPIQVESTSVVDARELVIQRYSDAFDAVTTLDEARARRKRWLKERKQQLHARAATQRKEDSIAISSTPGATPNSISSSGFQYKQSQRPLTGPAIELSASPPTDAAANSANQAALTSQTAAAGDHFGSNASRNPFSQQTILTVSSNHQQRGNSFKIPFTTEQPPPTRHSSGKDLQVSFTAGTSMESKGAQLAARASPASHQSLTIAQEEMLQQLAQALCRLLLTNLPSIGQRGMECMHILSAKLHLPAVTFSSGHKRGIVPVTVVRACAQRLMLLSIDDLKQIVLQNPMASALESSLAANRSTRRNHRGGSGGVGASNSIEAGMLSSMIGFGESPKMRLSGIFSLERPNSAGVTSRADDDGEDELKEPGRAKPHNDPAVDDPDDRFSPQSGAEDGKEDDVQTSPPLPVAHMLPDGASTEWKYSSSVAATMPFASGMPPSGQTSPRSTKGNSVLVKVSNSQDALLLAHEGDQETPRVKSPLPAAAATADVESVAFPTQAS